MAKPAARIAAIQVGFALGEGKSSVAWIDENTLLVGAVGRGQAVGDAVFEQGVEDGRRNQIRGLDVHLLQLVADFLAKLHHLQVVLDRVLACGGPGRLGCLGGDRGGDRSPPLAVGQRRYQERPAIAGRFFAAHLGSP